MKRTLIFANLSSRFSPQMLNIFYLETICLDLTVGLVNQLNRLSRFDCYVKENMSKETGIGDLTTIHQLHPCFNQVKYIKEEDDFRTFATK
jgi:hypothetical protein